MSAVFRRRLSLRIDARRPRTQHASGEWTHIYTRFVILAAVAAIATIAAAAPAAAENYYFRCNMDAPDVPKYFAVRVGAPNGIEGHFVEFMAEQRSNLDDVTKWTGKWSGNQCEGAGLACSWDSGVLKMTRVSTLSVERTFDTTNHQFHIVNSSVPIDKIYYCIRLTSEEMGAMLPAVKRLQDLLGE